MPSNTIAPEIVSDLSANLLSTATPADVQAQLVSLRALRQTVVLWLVALGLAGFTITLLLVTATIQDDIASSEAALQSIQMQLTRVSTPSAEVQSLTATLTETLALAAELEAVRPPTSVDWPAVMRQVGNFPSGQLVLTDLIQENNRLTLNGEAVDSSVITRYRSTLEASGLFTRVVIQTIKVVEPKATPTNSTAATAPANAVAFVIIMELDQRS